MLGSEAESVLAESAPDANLLGSLDLWVKALEL